MSRVLNVAEKPSVARGIADILSGGRKRMDQSQAVMNPVYTFTADLPGSPRSQVFFTSVRGFAFIVASIITSVTSESKDIEGNLLSYARKCEWLILWLDCDREGEAIAFEVVNICKRANPRIRISRAIFSAVTKSDIERACANLGKPNRNFAMAVEARQELDLRIGSTFTRFLTLNYKDMLETEAKVLSFGPCQIPTLAFVVDRFKAIEDFVAETFWTMKVQYKVNDAVATFTWDRHRLYDGYGNILLKNPDLAP
ncbi:bifunctional TOPRIM domain/DNA topoisomerase [Babesia duncani]|uniref:DNA topoisomerase n=1 Tax=Babesia duncani TaxID=323732 RepID=A0AAD9PJD9_9APIC|nr:bifunctional TOPRIM domain/DNA topoisomerase [Babesia duncani]